VGGGIQEATRRMRERKGQPGSTRVGTPAAGGAVACRRLGREGEMVGGGG